MKTPGLGSPVEQFTRFMFTRIIQRLSSFLAQNNFGISEVAALHIVHRSQSLTIQALSQQLNLSLSATSRLVSGLVKKGFFVRKEDPKDARAKIISCSKKGADLLDQMSLERVSAIFDAIQALPPEIPKRILGAISLFRKE